MRPLERGDDPGKKSARMSDQRFPGAVRVAWQNQGNQRLLVNPGQVQRLQPQGHGPASQFLRRRQTRLGILLKVFPQRRLILSR